MNLLVKVGLLAAVATVFPFMIGLGIEAFYQSPKDPYEVCADKMPVYKENQNRLPESDPEYKKCLDDQKAILNPYNRNVFIITTIAGFAAIAVGALYFSSEAMGPVAPGLVFGGLLTIMYGAGRSFEAVDKRLLFLELLVVLAGLIFVTRRYLKLTSKQ